MPARVKLPQVIGFAGPARVGKDTAAAWVERRGAIKASFADPLKAMLAAGLALTEEQLYGDLKETVDPRYGRTPRYIMQTLGTEWGRDLIGPDLWVQAMAAQLSDQRIVIPDVRFPNEAAFVRQHGRLIHLRGRGGIESDHVSERSVEPLLGEAVIINNGSIQQLHEGLYNALKS